MPNFYSTLRRLALTALLSGGGLLAARAQTLSQPLTGATNVAGTYTDLGTTGTVITTANTDNANSAAQPIGFSFGFNGTVFTQFVLNTNGVIRLGAAAPSSANLFIDGSASSLDPVQSLNSADVNLLLPFNIDLTSGTGGAEYRVATTGSVGSRICTIQWKNVADKTGTGTSNAAQLSNFSFQIRLYEGVGTIEFVYDAATASAAAANSRDVNVGLKGSGIATSQLLLATKASTTAWSAATFQNTGYGTSTFNIDKTVLPTSGVTYRFTDPTYCVAAAVSSYPYTQNFDGVTAPAIPCGFSVLDGNGDNNTWATYNSTAYSASGTNSMRYVGNSAIANDWFFTTQMAMTAGMSYQLQFKYRSYTAAYTQGLEVKVGNAATVAGQTTTLYTGTFNNATYNTSNNSQVALFTPTASGVYYFGFHATSAASQLWLLVDDVQITEVPTPACPQPTNIVVSSVAATSATVAFTPPTAGTTYSVVYGPKGFIPPTGGTATPLSSSTSVALTGLNSNTAYDVYVQATCGTAGTSVYTGPFTFTTACATVTGFPYNETFDSVTAPALPCGITVLDGNADGNTWATYSSTTYAASGTNAMRYVGNTNAANDWFFTNGLAMTVGKSYQLQFKYRSYTAAYNQGLEVKAGNAATVAGQTATVFTTTFSNATYNTTTNGQVVLFTPTASGTYYFGFHAISAASQMWLLVDDVQVTEITTPACLNPGNPVVSAITATGATITFTGPSNASGYSVIYGPKGFVPSSTSSSTPVAAGTTVTLTGLTSNSQYDVYVQSTCGTSGTSTLTGPVSFSTACATVTTYPYLENFDGVTAPTLPCGVTVIDVNGDGSTWKNTANSTYAASGTNAMQYSYSFTNPANDWFFTNALQMRVGYSYQLQFKYRVYSASYPEALEVKVGSAATVAGQTTTVFTNSNLTNITYATTGAGSGTGQVLLFTPTTAGIYYFGFHATSLVNQWNLYVDDVQVTEVVSPACPQPTALAVGSITTTGATVTFTGPTAGTSYTVIYGPKGFTPPTGGTTSAASASSPITLTGLASNTSYDVYVQATCGTAGTSTYTGPISFTTACATVTTFPYLETFDGVTAPALPCGVTVIDVNADGKTWVNTSGTTYAASSPNAMQYSYSGTNAANDWFFTNALSLQAGATYQLKFKYRSYSASFPEGLEVKVGNAATPAGQTTTVFTNTNITNTTYSTTTAGTAAGQVAGFTPTTTGIYYFGFHAISVADQFNLYVDDVQVDAISLAACPTPTNVTLSGITANTATVSFTGPTTLATGGYTIIYGPTGFNPTTGGTRVPATASPFTLTGLTSLTGYDVYVVASCAASVNSFPSAKASFTSACATTVTFPYLEKFDGVTAPTLPCGVTVLDANADGATWLNSNYNPSSGVNSMRYTPSTVNAADDWFFTNALSLKANMRYELSFKYRVFSYNYPEKMEVKVGTSTTAASQTTTLFSNMAMINATYTTTSIGALTGQVASYTPPADGTYFIGFHAMSIANQFEIYVDDIQVTAATVTSTKSNVAAGFSAEASPVPFGDRLTVTLNTLAAGPLQLTLHDAVGRVVRETSANVPAGASSLAVPGAGTLPAGMYMLTVRQGGNTQVIRVAHE